MFAFFSTMIERNRSLTSRGTASDIAAAIASLNFSTFTVAVLLSVQTSTAEAGLFTTQCAGRKLGEAYQNPQAVGAAVYALHCPDDTAPFLATWYTIAIVAVSALGALIFPRFLRW